VISPLCWPTIEIRPAKHQGNKVARAEDVADALTDRDKTMGTSRGPSRGPDRGPGDFSPTRPRAFLPYLNSTNTARGPKPSQLRNTRKPPEIRLREGPGVTPSPVRVQPRSVAKASVTRGGCAGGSRPDARANLRYADSRT
jgi:hypothetical protein